MWPCCHGCSITYFSTQHRITLLVGGCGLIFVSSVNLGEESHMHKHTPHLSTPHDHRCPPMFSDAVVVRNVVGGLCKRLVVLMHSLVMSVNWNALRLL